jgi:hypothetical protein
MRLAVLCLTLAATSALAGDFEGIITGKPTNTDVKKAGVGSMKMYIAPAGLRMEVVGEVDAQGKGDAGATPFQMIILWRMAEPGVTYMINDVAKAYMKHDLTKAKAEAAAKEPPKIEKLGKATYLGRPVERVKVISESHTEELWVDTSLHFPAGAVAALSQDRGMANASWRALEKAGVAGIPLKQLNADGTSGWEASSVEKKSLPASLFQLPAGFHEAKDPLDMAPPSQQAELKKRRDEALQKMTPEQRQKLEEMMKKYGQ